MVRNFELKDCERFLDIIRESTTEFTYKINGGRMFFESDYDDCNEDIIDNEEDGLLYIMIRQIPKNGLTIAQFNLNKTRNGIGTKFLNELIKFAKEEELDKIVMESVCSDKCENFCKKNGFLLVDNWKSQKDCGYIDYELNINN